MTSVGFTALAVCAARALDAALDPPLADDSFAAAFVHAAGEPNLVAAVADNDVNSAAAANARWVGVRTRFFDEFFQDATAAGLPQAVILAAGLDSRGYRLTWPPGHTLFEIDQPKVLEFKQQVLDEQGAAPSTHRVTVAIDLRNDWATALKEAGFDPAKPTAWALEGLLPYLPGAAQDALFETLHSLSAIGSRIAAELGPEPGEIAEFADGMRDIAGDATQAAMGDLWYDDPRTNAKDFLAQRHWAVVGVDLMERAANDYQRPLDSLPPIFHRLMRTKFVTAERTA